MTKTLKILHLKDFDYDAEIIERVLRKALCRRRYYRKRKTKI
jgi:hypothetical protein